MDTYSEDHSVEDSLFRQTTFAELVNTEVKLTPILHKVIKLREETQKLRIDLASLCVPMLINFRETLEMRNNSFSKKLEELEAAEKEVDNTNYEILLNLNATSNNQE